MLRLVGSFRPALFHRVVSFATVVAPSKETVDLTDGCIKRLTQLKKEFPDDPENVLRVAVTTGGCSGFSYQLRLVKDEPEDDDIIVEKNGGRVFIDEESMKNLAGSTIDYSHAMIEESFQVLANPHAEGGCGCGASFNLL